MGNVREEIKSELIRLIQDTLEIDADTISEESDLKEDLDLGSLDAIDVFMGIEEKFEVDFPYEELEKVHTVKGVIDYFEKVVSEKQQATTG